MPIPSTNASEELPAINEILASVGQAPVTTLDQTNPDVAIAYNTLLQVSREVQAEGWTFNTEFDVTKQTDSNKEYVIPNNMLQVDLTHNSTNYNKSVVRRSGKLYDRYKHTFEITDAADADIKLDVVYEYDWVDLPTPIQDYIVARTATVVSSRIVGDGQQYQILQQKEMQCRALALEYECNQGDYTFFGHKRGEKVYDSYKPYQALYR